MKRSGLMLAAALTGLAGAAFISTPAHAQGQPNMGGGFIEFLFSGGQSGAQPHYREQPALSGCAGAGR